MKLDNKIDLHESLGKMSKTDADEMLRVNDAFMDLGLVPSDEVTLEDLTTAYGIKCFELSVKNEQSFSVDALDAARTYKKDRKRLNDCYEIASCYVKKQMDKKSKFQYEGIGKDKKVDSYIEEVLRTPDGKDVDWTDEERLSFIKILKAVFDCFAKKDPSLSFRDGYMERSLGWFKSGSTYLRKLEVLMITAEPYLPETFDWNDYLFGDKGSVKNRAK